MKQKLGYILHCCDGCMLHKAIKNLMTHKLIAPDQGGLKLQGLCENQYCGPLVKILKDIEDLKKVLYIYGFGCLVQCSVILSLVCLILLIKVVVYDFLLFIIYKNRFVLKMSLL